ncbi:MAG: hypothetical protein H5U01_03405 [Clostridia bacterium]|nr:hypothetical protein [Clostridia bacterium]
MGSLHKFPALFRLFCRQNTGQDLYRPVDFLFGNRERWQETEDRTRGTV